MSEEELSATIAQAESQLSPMTAVEVSIEAKEAEALAKLVERMKPIMRLLDKPIIVRHSVGQYGEENRTEGRGLLLIDLFERPRHPGDQNRGDYTGTRLWLTREGEFIEQERVGEWSLWQNEVSIWEAKERKLDMPTVVHEYDLEDVVKGMNNALKEAITGSENKRKKLQGRADFLSRMLKAE